MLEGVEVSESKNQKDELILEGNDIDHVSQSGTRALVTILSPLILFQPLLSKVFAAFATRIFGNSWMVFMYPIGVRSLPTIKLFDCIFISLGLNIHFIRFICPPRSFTTGIQNMHYSKKNEIDIRRN